MKFIILIILFLLFWFLVDTLLSFWIFDKKDRSRWFSTIHALIISTYVYYFSTLTDKSFGKSETSPEFYCNLFIFDYNSTYEIGMLLTWTYLLFDWIVMYPVLEYSMKIHHAINIISLMLGTLSGIGQFSLFHCLFNEFSTIFLNMMLLTPRNSLKNKVFTWLFALSFLFVRIVLLTWILLNVIPCLDWNLPLAFYPLFVILVVHYLVNFYWWILIIKKLAI